MTDPHDAARDLRLACALAHTVPGATLSLTDTSGGRLTVAFGCLGSALDPCQLRWAIVNRDRCGVPRFGDDLLDIRLHGGLVDLGAGLYARRGPAGDERWFATLLDHAACTAVIGRCAADPHDATSATLRPDPDLGVTVVQIAAVHPAGAPRIDEVAFRVLAGCLVDELLLAATCEPGP